MTQQYSPRLDAVAHAGSEFLKLEARIRRLEDIEAIRKLKARYFHCIDRKEWETFRACFSEDAIWESAKRGLRLVGVDEIFSFITYMDDDDQIVNCHQGHDPEIEITSDTTATGLWELFRYLEDKRENTRQVSAAFYQDDYVKVDGLWRIRHCRITPIFLPYTI